jgi:hypothetical protein
MANIVSIMRGAASVWQCRLRPPICGRQRRQSCYTDVHLANDSYRGDVDRVAMRLARLLALVLVKTCGGRTPLLPPGGPADASRAIVPASDAAEADARCAPSGGSWVASSRLLRGVGGAEGVRVVGRQVFAGLQFKCTGANAGYTSVNVATLSDAEAELAK